VLDLDVDAFEQAINQASAADDDAVFAALERAAASYTGDLLPDCYDEWLIEERERLRHLLFTALERLVGLLEQHRAYAAAIPHARRLASLDMLNEAACLTLMRLHTLNGDRASALRVYHSFASTLQNELGTLPGTVLYEAYERLLTAQAAPADAPSAGMNAAPLVGREREWKRMQATWQVAASGQPRLLLLWGEAGIGKTRLAEDLLSWANRQGIITAVAHCYAAEGDLAYAPVTALLRADALRPGIARLSGEWLAEVSRLAPDLPIKSSVPPRPLTERWQRQRLFEALAKVVLAPNRPTLLLIDDLQWCDHDTLEWLHFLLRYQTGTRLLVVGTIRAEEVGDDHALTPLLEALRRENRIAEIALNPLSREETIALAAHVVGRALSSERSEILYRETEGNPLFVVETLRSEGWAGSAPGVDSPAGDVSVLPPSVQAVVTRRLSQLSPPARAILEVAAVIGRSFTFEVVTQAVDLDEDAVVRGLDELWQRRVVREHGADAYDFTHGKLRSVAYAGLSVARQRVLHRRVAEALEAESAANLDPVSGQIAAHYQQAGRKAQASAYHRRAAEYARRLYANEVAILHLQQALALSDKPEEVASLSDGLGEVLHFVGRYEAAREAWQRALDGTPEADHIARANLYRKLGNAWRDQYRYDEAQAAYDAAEAALGSPDAEPEAARGCRAQIQLERMNVLYWQGRISEMLALIDQLRHFFEHDSSLLQQARLHQVSSVALLRATRYSRSPDGVEHARAHLHMMKEAGEAGALPSAHFQYGFGLLWGTDDLDGAEREILIALSLSQQSGDVSLQTRCLTYLTVIARLRGDIEQTHFYAEQSLSVAETTQMPEYIGAARGSLAWVAWRKGAFDVARAHGQAALAAWKRPPAYMFEWLARLPLLALALEIPDEAAEHARALLDQKQKRLARPVEAALEAAVAAKDAGDAATCRAFLAQAVEAAEQVGYL
jgi:tetratricopeptide (TPR) repeat protein